MKNEEKIAKLSRDNLSQFVGSQKFTRWSPLFQNHVLTEGALYVAENAGAYWLMDLIASYQGERKFKEEDFQVWEIHVDLEKGKAVVICTDGNDNEIQRQLIPSTDFPVEKFSLWAERNDFGGVTILLPSEH